MPVGLYFLEVWRETESECAWSVILGFRMKGRDLDSSLWEM